MSGPCRVLVLNERDPLHPRAGGAEVHVAQISRRLAALGYEITQLACSFPGAAEEQEIDGLRVRRLGALATYYPRAVAATARETRGGAFDVVVEHLNKVPFCAAAYAAAPVIAVNHHLFGRSAFLQAAWPIAAAVVAVERLIPRVYRRVDFLAVSESSRQDLIERGVPADRIDLLHNGIVFPDLEPKPIAERPRRIVYLGRLETYKRIDLLLRAVARLAATDPELELVIVGRGDERPRLERLADVLGIGQRTRFTGFVSDGERDRLVASSRVYVCPSVKEGWGITVIEANALGVPAVATNAPGLRDAVRDGRTGVLVEDGPPESFVARLANAVGTLLDDEERLGRFSVEAASWARRFDWEVSAQRMADAIEAARQRASFRAA
jgi:glycosyltransferase involved in cell wall biosynthesis